MEIFQLPTMMGQEPEMKWSFFIESYYIEPYYSIWKSGYLLFLRAENSSFERLSEDFTLFISTAQFSFKLTVIDSPGAMG